MKKFIITLFMLIPLCTGCSNVDANVDFLDSKNVMFSANIASQNSISKEEVMLIKNNYKNFLDGDYITDVHFTNDSAKIQAVKISKNVKRNDLNLSSIGLKTNNKNGRFIEVKQNFFITLYKVDLVYDLNAQAQKFKNKTNKKTKNLTALKPVYLQKYGDEDITLDDPEIEEEDDFRANFEENSIVKREASESQDNSDKENEQEFDWSDLTPRFSITLPSKASFNNADNVVDNVYYWNIKSDEPTSIKLQYIVYNSWAIFLLILFVFGILYILARKILKYDSQKRVGANN